MPSLDYHAVRAEVRLAEGLALLGWVPRGGFGPQRRGPCPVHRSRSSTGRSFSVHLDKGLWHCFRCGAGGNVLDLWVAVTGLPLHAAVLDLYQHLGRAVPWPATPRRTGRSEVRMPGA